MFRHILIPTDGSKCSAAAIKQGVKLAKALHARITGLHVIPPFHSFTYRTQVLLSYHAALPEDSQEAYERTTRSEAAKILHVLSRAAEAAGVRCDTVQVHDDQPYKAILDTAAKKRVDLILMASHGHGGLGAVLLGSETQKVLTHTTIPVLVVR